MWRVAGEVVEMPVSREAGDGVEMSCDDWTVARGDSWRAEVAFFSSKGFLLERDELELEEMSMCSNMLLTTSFT